MLPKFDVHGNLPPGIYTVTFAELDERFGGAGAAGERRAFLAAGLRRLYEQARGQAIGMFVNGSYVTSKRAPGDVDIALVLPDGFSARSRLGRELLRLRAGREQNGLEIFPFKASDQARIDRWLQGWCQDRDGNPKGIVYVEVGPDD